MVLKAKDALSASVRASAKSLEAFKAEAESLKKKLSTLEKQDGLLSAFQKQTVAVRDSKKAYKEAESQVERLAKEYQKSDKPTKAITKSLNAARQSVIKSNTAYQNQRKKLTDLSTGLNQAGLSSRDIAKQQKKLAAEIKKTAAAYGKANTKAKQTNKTLRSNALIKLPAASTDYHKGLVVWSLLALASTPLNGVSKEYYLHAISLNDYRFSSMRLCVRLKAVRLL